MSYPAVDSAQTTALQPAHPTRSLIEIVAIAYTRKGRPAGERLLEELYLLETDDS